MRVKCYTIIEATAGEPIGVHVMPMTDEGLTDACELVCRLWQEQDLCPIYEDDVKRELELKSCYRTANKSADYAIHVQKNVRKS